MGRQRQWCHVLLLIIVVVVPVYPFPPLSQYGIHEPALVSQHLVCVGYLATLVAQLGGSRVHGRAGNGRHEPALISQRLVCVGHLATLVARYGGVCGHVGNAPLG